MPEPRQSHARELYFRLALGTCRLLVWWLKNVLKTRDYPERHSYDSLLRQTLGTRSLLAWWLRHVLKTGNARKAS